MKKAVSHPARSQKGVGRAPPSMQTHHVSSREGFVREVRQLRDAVERLSTDMSHLGNEVQALRQVVGTDLGLERFPSERPRADRLRSVHEAHPAESPEVDPALQVTMSPPAAVHRVVVGAGWAAGLALLLIVVALPRIGNPFVSVSDSMRDSRPLASRSVDVVASHAEWLQPPRGVALVDMPRRFFFSQTRAQPASHGESLSRLLVARSGVGSEVIEKELVGRSDTFGVGTSATFWTHVVGGRQGDTIHHVWFHDGREAVTIALPIGSGSWRTQSRHTLTAESEGEWTVESRDREGRLLASQRFRCEE